MKHGREHAQTRWSIVRLLAGVPEEAISEERWHEAWDGLCRTYQPAMEGVVRRTLMTRGGAVRLDEAEDIVQDFLLACLEKNYLIKADRRIGKFRTFLAVCLRRYAIKYCAARHTQRRLPDKPMIPIDEALDALEAPDDGSGDADVFAEEWARCLVDSALVRVGDRSEANADLLRQFLLDPTQTPTELSERLAVPKQRVALQTFRAKRMLAEEIWECCKDTASSLDDAEAEREALQPYLARYLGADDAPSLYGTP